VAPSAAAQLSCVELLAPIQGIIEDIDEAERQIKIAERNLQAARQGLAQRQAEMRELVERKEAEIREARYVVAARERELHMQTRALEQVRQKKAELDANKRVAPDDDDDKSVMRKSRQASGGGGGAAAAAASSGGGGGGVDDADKKRFIEAVDNEDVEAVRALLTNDKSLAQTPMVVDNELATPLHAAALAGNIALVKLLLAAGAQVNARDAYDDTPMHSATGWGHEAVIKLLLAHGGDINARNKNDFDPSDSAEDGNFHDLAAYMRSVPAYTGRFRGSAPAEAAAPAAAEARSPIMTEGGDREHWYLGGTWYGTTQSTWAHLQRDCSQLSRHDVRYELAIGDIRKLSTRTHACAVCAPDYESPSQRRASAPALAMYAVPVQWYGTPSGSMAHRNKECSTRKSGQQFYQIHEHNIRGLRSRNPCKQCGNDERYNRYAAKK
jgi:hypothetical protein